MSAEGTTESSTPNGSAPSAGFVSEHCHGSTPAPRYRRYEYDLVAPHCGRSVLEVGAGMGHFSAELLGRDRLVLSDPEPYCLDSLRARFAQAPGVEVIPLSVPGGTGIGDPVETVVAMNVLEHIADHVGALRDLSRLVVPGGRIVLWVPGYQALYGDFDRKVGHVRRYTPRTLATAAADARLAVEVLHPVNLLGGLAWWLAVRRGRAETPNPRLVSLYDRLVIPTTRLIERFVKPPFGQSIFCVVRTPTA